jgi:hypothetical protein
VRNIRFSEEQIIAVRKVSETGVGDGADDISLAASMPTSHTILAFSRSRRKSMARRNEHYGLSPRFNLRP